MRRLPLDGLKLPPIIQNTERLQIECRAVQGDALISALLCDVVAPILSRVSGAKVPDKIVAASRQIGSASARRRLDIQFGKLRQPAATV